MVANTYSSENLSTHIRALALVLSAGAALLSAPNLTAQENKIRPVVLSKQYDALVPRYLLGLLHAPEVQQELELSESGISKLEDGLFARIDGPWLRTRKEPDPKKAFESVAKIERATHAWLIKNFTPKQQARLLQLEHSAQAFRAFLRDDVAKKLSLEEEQLSRYAVLARAADEAMQAFTRASYSSSGASDAQKQAVAKTMAEERSGFKEIFKPEQIQAFVASIGDAFDTAQLQRIMPMSPELVDAKEWINSDPIRLRDLRGKVVLLHFYAFQCHNCHANFDIYRKWHDDLRSKGVVVLGIQSPETPSERDPAKVRAAAKEKDLDFPILIDTEMKTWNAYGNTMWPTVYVIDQDGYLRKVQMGELQWKGATYDKDVEKLVDQLLSEKESNT